MSENTTTTPQNTEHAPPLGLFDSVPAFRTDGHLTDHELAEIRTLFPARSEQ